MPPRQWRQRLRPGDGEGDSDSGPDADGTAAEPGKGRPPPAVASRAAGRTRCAGRGAAPGRSLRPGSPRAAGPPRPRGHEVTDARRRRRRWRRCRGHSRSAPHPRREGRRWRCGRVSPGRDPASRAAPRSRGPGSGRGAWGRRTPELGWPVLRLG